MLNATFLETFPKVKAISFFEFIKFEEHSWRDFTTMGGYGNINSPLGNDGATLDSGVLAAFQADLRNGVGNLLQWANPTQSQKTENTTVVNQTPSSNSGGFKSSAFQLLSLVLVSILYMY